DDAREKLEEAVRDRASSEETRAEARRRLEPLVRLRAAFVEAAAAYREGDDLTALAKLRDVVKLAADPSDRYIGWAYDYLKNIALHDLQAERYGAAREKFEELTRARPTDKDLRSEIETKVATVDSRNGLIAGIDARLEKDADALLAP